ncbi:MAG: DNA replication/repair protein RecF [Candidatus Sericytochromatia bacterium]|nr:DNA replication/repair protein RecF [Candidatus Sericytochromatia bacterium]
MLLHHLELTDYRNYRELAVDFDARKVILLGDNAQGKSNVLEAIGLIATGKSPTAPRDADLVRWGEQQAILRARATREAGELALDMLVRASGRRAFRLNGLPQRRLADVLGRLLVVFFRSEDLNLVKGGPGERRELLDTMLMQLSGAYHTQLADYGRVLTQRNHLLRAIAEGRSPLALLEAFDEQLIALALGIWGRRHRLVVALEPRVASRHAAIAEGREVISLRYVPAVRFEGPPEGWEPQLRQALAAQQRQELARGQSLVGPHRDDLELLIDGRPAKVFGSQGQQRTVVLALKLAELEHLQEATGEAPLLLLDDVLAELDVRRQNALLASIGDGVQTFVTSTHLNDFSAAWLDTAALFTVRAGELSRSAAPGAG